MDVVRNVLIADDGAQFGRPGKGFTVMQTAHESSPQVNTSDGIVIAANSVMVRGNLVRFSHNGVQAGGRGIHTGNQLHSVRIEGNLVTDWSTGIEGGQGITISKNQVMDNVSGILADGGSVVGNVTTGNDLGIEVNGSPQVISNAAYANNRYGIVVLAPFSGVITKNNLLGNGCGVGNFVGALVAENNYWGGAPTGTGSPADFPCNFGPTDVTPFATKPFTVKVLKP